MNFNQLIKGKKYIACIVPQTHWDRAWYHPFEQFRISPCYRMFLPVSWNQTLKPIFYIKNVTGRMGNIHLNHSAVLKSDVDFSENVMDF